MKRNALFFAVIMGSVVLTCGHRVTTEEANAEPSGEAERERWRELADNETDVGDELVKKGEMAAACGHFETADRLDPSLVRKGTYFGCLEKLGHYLDAYERMLKVAADSKDEQTKRDATAEASRILGEAPCIIIDVADHSLKILELEIAIDGQTLPQGSWGKTCFPVNLGDHTITATAPLHWPTRKKESTIAPKTQYRVTIAPPQIKPKNTPSPIPRNPVNKATFAVPGLLLATIGASSVIFASQIASPHDAAAAEIFGYSLLGSAAVVLGTGGIIYAVSEPNPADSNQRIGLSRLHIGVMGRF